MDKRDQIIARNSYINSLNSCISSSKTTLVKLLRVFGWNEQLTVVTESECNLVQCSVDRTHRVLLKNLKAHEEACRWQQQGYRKDSVPFPEASTPSRNTVILDKAKQAQVILEAAVRDPTMKIGGAGGCGRLPPQTSERLFSDFTTDERRVMYDHVVSLTRGTMPELQEFAMPVVEDALSGPKTKEQIMALERDAKRRRVRHRSLKVHTRSKNYSQVLREVINNQMSAYEDWLKAYHGGKTLASPEKTRDVEGAKTSVGQEMEWVEWDRKCNPHLWWKRVLEWAKREKDKEKLSEVKVERGERSYQGNCDFKRKRDHYEEEQYNRKEREKRRRIYETKSAKRSRRNYSDEDEEKRHSRRERERRRSYMGEGGKRRKYGSEDSEEEKYSRREREKRRDKEDGKGNRSRVDSSGKPGRKTSPREELKIYDIKKEVDDCLNYESSTVVNKAMEGQSIMDSSFQIVNIKQENTDDNIQEEGDLLRMDKMKKNVYESAKCSSEPDKILDTNLLHMLNVKQREDDGSDESSITLEQALVADKLLENVKEKLENGESLDDAQVRIAKKIIFKRLELIGKEMPSDRSSSDENIHSERKNKVKKKKRNIKSKKNKV